MRAARLGVAAPCVYRLLLVLNAAPGAAGGERHEDLPYREERREKQGADNGGEGDEEGKDRWQWDLKLRSTFRYDSNVFNLSDDQKDRLEGDHPGDETSGRFEDMNSIDDFVFLERADGTFRFRGLGGRWCRIEPGLGVDIYTLNPRRTHPVFDLGLNCRRTQLPAS